MRLASHRVLIAGMLIASSGFVFAAPEGAFPLQGEVTAERVNFRAGASMTAKIMGLVSMGDTVVVAGEEGDFYLILPPAGAGAWVQKRFLASSDGKTGKVGAEGAVLRSDSRMNADAMAEVPAGTEIAILRDYLDWYRVQAPETVRFYVSKKFVKTGGPAAVVLAHAAPKAGVAPVADVSGKSPVGGGSLAEAVRLAKAEDEKADVRDRDYAPAIAEFQAAAAAGNAAEQARARESVKPYEKLQAAIEAYRKAKAEGEQQIREWEEKYRDALSRVGPARRSPLDFEFTGWVDTTGRYLIDRPGTHKLIKGESIQCFLVAAPGVKIDLNRFYRRFVGVKGKIADAPAAWSAYKVVTVEEIEELDDK